jgi:predicted CXXCH cytochrome family protein
MCTIKDSLPGKRMCNIRINKIAILLIAIIVVAGFCKYSYAVNVSGTKHDFTGSGDSAGLGFGLSSEECSPCHVPHNADTTSNSSLLWNHNITNASFTLYSSQNLDSDIVQPMGSSRLCLSCHDGTVAIDAFGGRAGKISISGAALISNDLSDDHPVSFIYDAALAIKDGELYDPGSTDSGLGDTIQNDLLFNNRFECSSCHDAHDNSNGKFLRVRNDRSRLCLTCHIK